MTASSGAHPWFPGVAYALASAALFGLTAPASKVLLDNVDPFFLAGLLYLGAGVGLSAFRLFNRLQGKDAEAAISRADWPWLAMAIGMGGIVGPILLMFGLSRISASSASLLLNLEGLATMGIAWLVYKENVDRRLLLGAAAILAGAVLLSAQGTGISLEPGALLIAAACLAWGIDNNFTRKISGSDPVAIASLKGLVAGPVNLGLAYATGSAMPSAEIWAAGAAVGLVSIGVSLVLFILALRHLGTARTGAYYSLAPFIGAVLAVALLGEPLELRLIVAGLLMGLGLYLHLTERHEHEHSH